MLRLIAVGMVIAAIGSACNNAVPPSLVTSSTTSTIGGPAPTITTTSITAPPADLGTPATVTAVIDGDTFKATVGGQEVDVRLLGINAPESDECYGAEARTELTDLLGDFNVTMVAGKEDVDEFGRLLRYVYVQNGNEVTFVNQRLVADGAALGLQNGHEFQTEFKALEERAYASGRGMWGTFVCGHPKGGVTPDRPQLRIGELSPDPPGPDDKALDEEWIEIVNESYTSVSLSGWILRDESSSHRLHIPRVGLNPGDTLRVVTGCGTSGGGVVYWCADGPIWNNGGDTVIIEDARGNVVDHKVYGPTS